MSLREVALSPDEKDRVLAICGSKALLVGGQALAVWAVYYGVAPAGVLSQVVTTDVDYIGSAEIARALRTELGPPWQLREAGRNDIGTQTAIVFARVGDDGLKQVDFLSGVVGLDTNRARDRAVELQLAVGYVIRLLHPLDVLESRLSNLAALPAKRDEFGVEQARLAIDVVRAFILSQLDDGAAPRVVFRAIQNVRRLALNTGLASIAFQYDLVVLDAIPANRIQAPKFTDQMWPRLVAAVRKKRASYDAHKNATASGPRRDPLERQR